jgi:hypothetical protein
MILNIGDVVKVSITDESNFCYHDYTATVEAICQTKNTGV